MRRRRPASEVVLGAVLVALFAASREARAFVTTFGCAGASSCTLAELFAGGGIQVNYTRFMDWELEFIDPDGVQPDFSLIVVQGRDDGGLVPGDGIEFMGNGELLVSGQDRLDMAIGFTVADIHASLGIQGNSLTLSSHSVVGSVNTLVTIGEFVADGNGVGLGQKECDSDPILSDAIDLSIGVIPPGRPQLIIEKDILLQSAAVADSAQLDRFEQRFSLPEPEGSVLLGAGVVGLWVLNQLRSRRAAKGHRKSST
jgi:hypothetical protein